MKTSSNFSEDVQQRGMFVYKTTTVLLHLRICLRAQQNDSIVYALKRVTPGMAVAKYPPPLA
jgi:hypothetical protein